MHAQDIDWRQTSNWRLYDSRSIRNFDVPTEKILQSKSNVLDSGSIYDFLSAATKMDSGDSPVWMGYYVASCKTRAGETKLFYISVYGGFFYDRDKKVYYLIAEDSRKGWLDYLLHVEASLQTIK